ncbi:MAG: peptidylprolyl isomerase [Gammaproteobacteria bacterium]|nr:peptidylprolyl isomerase [Gammaproteobacteria bacterium]
MRTLLVTALICCAPVACSAESTAPPETGNPQVEIATSMGMLTVELWPEKAPLTVDNFLKLVNDGFYVGTVFHRVIPNFMIQAGGYDAGLAYREPPRTVVNESANGALNVRWTIAMARHSDPDSADSQFFINVADNAHLDATPDKPGYTVFGTLIRGRTIAEDIELAETGHVGDKISVPLEPIVILSTRRVSGVESE